MKIDRLVSIILMLLEKKRISAQELAEMFEVSPRTATRILSSAFRLSRMTTIMTCSCVLGTNANASGPRPSAKSCGRRFRSWPRFTKYKLLFIDFVGQDSRGKRLSHARDFHMRESILLRSGNTALAPDAHRPAKNMLAAASRIV